MSLKAPKAPTAWRKCASRKCGRSKGRQQHSYIYLSVCVYRGLRWEHREGIYILDRNTGVSHKSSYKKTTASRCPIWIAWERGSFSRYTERDHDLPGRAYCRRGDSCFMLTRTEAALNSAIQWKARILVRKRPVSRQKRTKSGREAYREKQHQRFAGPPCAIIRNSHDLGLSKSVQDFSSVQSLSCVQLFATPWTAARQASLSITNSRSLLKLMSVESVMPSNHLILCHPLLLPPSMFPRIRVFSKKSVLCIRRPKYWSFGFSISPSNEYSGLISFRMDWLDLLAVQGTLKSLLQHHSSKASILQCSAFLLVQLSYPYVTPGKTIALTRQTFVGKVMSLLFNMLSWS